MAGRSPTNNDLAVTLRVLARLLQYPDAAVRGHLHEMRAALHGARIVSRQRLAELDALADGLLAHGPVDTEADYCLLYTSPSPRDGLLSRMPSSA